MARPLDEAEIVAARRIIAIQASTRPADGNIGPAGAWKRAENVSILGRNAHERIGDQPLGFPSQTRRRLLRG